MKREVAAVLAAAAPKKQVISVEYVRFNRAKRTSNGASCVHYVPGSLSVMLADRIRFHSGDVGNARASVRAPQ